MTACKKPVATSIWHQLRTRLAVAVASVLGKVSPSGRPRRGSGEGGQVLASPVEMDRIGPYRILGRLGRGGMAEVLLAEKAGPGGFTRQLAIKRIRRQLSRDPDSVAMFLDEARIAAHLHHPHIVQIHDVDSEGSTYYMALELMDGPSLAEIVRRARIRNVHLPWPVVVAVGSALLNALGYAHRTRDQRGRSLGLIHRDVKPSNILTSLQGDVKLTDFGIAKAKSRLYQTGPGKARGTPAYMAPELRAGDTPVPQSDLFAAGATIFEAIALRRAFPYGIGARAATPRLPPMVEPALARPLAGFFDRALAFWPEQRFARAEEMKKELLAALAPISPASVEEIAAYVASVVPRAGAVDSDASKTRLSQDLPSTVRDRLTAEGRLVRSRA